MAELNQLLGCLFGQKVVAQQTLIDIPVQLFCEVSTLIDLIVDIGV